MPVPVALRVTEPVGSNDPVVVLLDPKVHWEKPVLG
jgi:hypothetical protein